MVVKDIVGNLYTVGYMHGVYSIRNDKGIILGYDTDVQRLIRSTIGHNAEIITNDIVDTRRET